MSATPSAPPVSAPAADALSIALTTAFGPWGALAALAYRFGSPFVMKIIQNSHTAVDPTPDEWAKLDAEIDVPGEVLIPQRGVPPKAS